MVFNTSKVYENTTVGYRQVNHLAFGSSYRIWPAIVSQRSLAEVELDEIPSSNRG